MSIVFIMASSEVGNIVTLPFFTLFSNYVIIHNLSLVSTRWALNHKILYKELFCAIYYYFITNLFIFNLLLILTWQTNLIYAHQTFYLHFTRLHFIAVCSAQSWLQTLLSHSICHLLKNNALFYKLSQPYHLLFH